MANGIIVIDKPQEWTSMDVCAKIRGVLHERRVGHAGTLDPMATGVLPVFVGRATRAVEFASESEKEYIAGLKLGVVTNTQDTTGQVVEERPVEADRAALEGALAAFRGEITQIPPMYSALKVNGKKLYELARQGKEVERQARPVQILDIQIESIDLPRATFFVTCSKGTYIRTLCYDIGRKLGCGGCMESLLRTRVDRFELKDSLTLSQIEKLRDEGRLEEAVVPVEGVFLRLPALVTKPGDGDKLLHNGNPFPAELAEAEDCDLSVEFGAGSDCAAEPAGRSETECGLAASVADRFDGVRVYDSEHHFIGIYRYSEEKRRYQPQKIFLGGN